MVRREMVAGEGDGVVAVLALIGGDDDGGVVGGAFHALLHRALAVRAPVVAPTHTYICVFNNIVLNSGSCFLAAAFSSC